MQQKARWIRRLAVLLCAAASLTVGAWLLIRPANPEEPVFEDRRVGEWLHDLASTSIGESATTNAVSRERHARALSAFSRMGSKEVPYLVSKLRTPDSRLQRILFWAAPAIGRSESARLHWPQPEVTRLMAGQALARMGTNAADLTLLPLVEAFANERSPSVKRAFLLYISHVAGIPALKSHQGISLPPAVGSEAEVMKRVRERHPHLFPSSAANRPQGSK